MNASDYMAAVNELRYNDLPSGGWYQDYSREYVENYTLLNRENPDLYPNVNWMDMVLKDVGVRHSHSLTIQSGGDKRSSVLSLGFDDVDGLFRKNLSWKRYTARLNNDIQVFKWMKASADISLRYTDQVNPHASPSGTMRYIPPIYQAVWSDGRYAPGKDGVNPYAALMSGGEKDTDKYLANAKFQLDITPVKGLTVTDLLAPVLLHQNQGFSAPNLLFQLSGGESHQFEIHQQRPDYGTRREPRRHLRPHHAGLCQLPAHVRPGP